MKTLIGKMTGMSLGEERKVAVQMGVPGDSSDTDEGSGSKSCTRAHNGLN